MDKKEKIKNFADQLMTFLPLIDMFTQDVDDLKEWVKNMKDDVYQKESIGVMFDMDALEKADIQKLQVEVFDKLIKLIEARQKQIKETPEFQKNIGKRAEIVEHLGL